MPHYEMVYRNLEMLKSPVTIFPRKTRTFESAALATPVANIDATANR
jgi:hypothetical protein